MTVFRIMWALFMDRPVYVGTGAHAGRYRL